MISSAGRKAALFVLILAFLTFAVNGETEERNVVEDIRIEGTVRIDPETIFYYIKTAVGDPYDPEAIRKDFHSIYNTGLFDNVRILQKEGATGTILIIRVKEKPTIRNIEFRGTKVVTGETIKEQLEQVQSDIKIGVPLDMNKVIQTEKIIKLILKEEGLRFASVDHKIEEINETAVNLVFEINEGDQIKIGKIYFTGNTVFSERKLRRTMKQTKQSWIFSWITRNNVYSEMRYQEDAEKVRSLYYDQGYVDLLIKEPAIEIKEERSTFRKKLRKRLHLTIPLVEGEQYQMGKLSITGNAIIEEEKLRSRFKIVEGEIFSRGAIEEAMNRIQEDYGELGYIFVSTIPTIDQDQENLIVNIDLLIKENEKYYINRIEFRGNSSTRDKVLRRELRIAEGDLFNQKLFTLSILKLNQLGYFDEVTHDVLPVEGENVVDVVVDVIESGKNSIQFGGGYSGLEGAFGSFAFSTRNFFGKGQTFTFQGQIGGRTQNFFIQFFEPYLLDKNVGAGVSVFKRHIEYFDFTRNSVGGNVRLSRNLTNFMFASIKYEYEVIEITDIAPSFYPSIQDPENPDAGGGTGVDPFFSKYFQKGTRKSSSITPVLLRNTINNPFDPIFGTRLLGSFQFAGSFLGGSLDFYKLRLTGSKYLPLSMKHILAGNVEFGYADGYGGAELPIYERYFLGGEQSIRGLPLRSVGPRDENGNIIGGNKYFLINAEYNYRIGRPMRLVWFFDAGNAYSEGDSLDLRDLRKSTGMEFRMFIPHLNIPLRLIVAYNIDPMEDEDRINFQFGFQPIF